MFLSIIPQNRRQAWQDTVQGKTAQWLLPSMLAVMLAACSGGFALRGSRIPYQTLYYDRNGDGMVDGKSHRAIDKEEGWMLWDTDFDGRFDDKILLGPAISRQIVNVPVPKNVPLSPVPNHLRVP